MCHTDIPRVALAVFCASIFGYTRQPAVRRLVYNYFANDESPCGSSGEVHAGVFGEFLVAYMGSRSSACSWSPASRSTRCSRHRRSSWRRCCSPDRCSNERTRCRRPLMSLPSKQAENEYQALHDSLTGMPNRMFFHQRLLARDRARARDRRPHGRDVDGPRPLQGDQRHARPPLRRPAAAGDRAAAVRACCATTT